jgi:hypothetical protein
MNDSLMWIGIGAAALTGLWAGYTSFYEGNLDGPRYQTQRVDGAFELRQYQPFVIAQTAMTSAKRKGMSGGFRVLAGYIFGGNQPAERLPMTAPVVTQKGGESLGMTAPVLIDGRDNMMAFVMPEGRGVADLPLPNSNQVRLLDVDWGLTASIRYNMYASPKRVAAHKSQLLEWVRAQGYRATSEPMSAQYNSPSAMPLLRRNEIIVSVEKITSP